MSERHDYVELMEDDETELGVCQVCFESPEHPNHVQDEEE